MNYKDRVRLYEIRKQQLIDSVTDPDKLAIQLRELIKELKI